MAEPAITFEWHGADEVFPRIVSVYTLREGPLETDENHVKFLVALQDRALQARSVIEFGNTMKILAGEWGLWVGFYPGPDHTDPLATRIAIGFKPHGIRDRRRPPRDTYG